MDDTEIIHLEVLNHPASDGQLNKLREELKKRKRFCPVFNVLCVA